MFKKGVAESMSRSNIRFEVSIFKFNLCQNEEPCTQCIKNVIGFEKMRPVSTPPSARPDKLWRFYLMEDGTGCCVPPFRHKLETLYALVALMIHEYFSSPFSTSTIGIPRFFLFHHNRPKTTAPMTAKVTGIETAQYIQKLRPPGI